MRLRGIMIALFVAMACLGVCAVALGAGGHGGPDPAVKKWPDWPGRVSCSGLPFDPLVAFSRPTNAERGNRPSEVALREVLAAGLYSQFGAPRHGWRLLAESSNYAQFASGRLGHRVQLISVARRKKGWEQGQNERLKPPVFREENGALLMALWLRPVHGAQTCQALGEPPVTIELPEPLGNRRLLDGSVFPPLSPIEREG